MATSDKACLTPQTQASSLIPVMQEHGEAAPAFPLARITTCGRLAIETLSAIHTSNEGQMQAVYGPPDPALLARKGSSTALILLALLVSQPGCFASKDWLSEKLGRGRELEDEEEEESEGMKRVDNVVSRLRFLLLPAQAHEQPEIQQIRRHLVEYRRASRESGPGYQLAGMPWLWVDVVDVENQIERARLLERLGEDGLVEWQTACDVLMAGPFLPGEVYSDWAEWRRQRLETHLWDCVQTLWQRAVEQGAAGEKQAIHLLHTYWQSHPTNEDSLRPLLELFGKRERFSEAQVCYDRLCTLLADEGKQPDQRTQDVMKAQQAKQIRRTPVAFRLGSFGNTEEQDGCNETMNYGRRQLIKEIGTGIGATSMMFFFPSLSTLADVSEQLRLYQEHVPLHWDGYFTTPEHNALATIISTLAHLQHISPYAKPSQQETIQMLLCQYHQLAADQLRDRGQLSAALKHGELAVYLAERLQHVELLAAALYRRGLTHFDAGRIQAASRDLNEALPFARISRSQLKGMVFLEAGRFQAWQARSQDEKKKALRLIDQTGDIVRQELLETDAGFVKLNEGRYHIGRAATLLALEQLQEASEELQLARQLTPAEYQRRHAYITILQARSSFLRRHYEHAGFQALNAFHICKQVHSESNIADLARLSQELMQSPSGQAEAIQELSFQIRQYQKGAFR